MKPVSDWVTSGEERLASRVTCLGDWVSMWKCLVGSDQGQRAGWLWVECVHTPWFLRQHPSWVQPERSWRTEADRWVSRSSDVKKSGWGLPWWLSGKESTRAGDMGSIPDPERSHMPRVNEAHPSQLLSLCSRAQEPQWLSPCAAAEAWESGDHAPQQGQSQQWDSNALQPEREFTVTREKPAQQWRPRTAKNKQTEAEIWVVQPHQTLGNLN